MTITLTDELEQFGRCEVNKGAFASSSEHIRELISERYRLKQDRDDRLKTLDAALARGRLDSAAGRVMPLDEAFEKIRAAIGIADDESHA